MTNKKLAVIAIGGNSLIKDKAHRTVQDQYKAAKETASHIVDMIAAGWDVAIGHGNGPQVGFILRRSEIAAKTEGLHEVPLDVCGADTQGAIGYALQQNLQNELRKRGIQKNVATVVTQVLVDKNDPAFQNPTKPIGSFMDEAEAKQRAEKDGWNVVEDAGRGWRRVVPSPIPQRVVELDAVKTLLDAGGIVFHLREFQRILNLLVKFAPGGNFFLQIGEFFHHPAGGVPVIPEIGSFALPLQFFAFLFFFSQVKDAPGVAGLARQCAATGKSGLA